MKKPVICKVCGYIMEEGKLGEVCPACGVPKTAFIPYEDRVSEKRRKILDLHLHNITVHFPQAFSVLMLFLLFVALFIRGIWQAEFLATTKTLSIFLPFSVMAGLFTGRLDGKTRFKRLNTLVLQFKMKVGFVFLLVSVALFLVFHLPGLTTTWHLVALGLSACASAFSMVLGYNGGRLAGLVLPG